MLIDKIVARLGCIQPNLLAAKPEWELYLLNRGNRSDELPGNVKVIQADINDEEKVKEAIKDLYFDCVCDFIVYNFRFS